MSGARWLVCEMGGVKRMAWDEGDEWCMMAGDEWRGLSGERWVVGDECVCDVLYEMSEMSSVRCLCMWYVVWEMNEMSGVRWWWEMSDVRWVDEDEWCEVSGVTTATPNDVYTQQGAKPACQEDINAKIPHLILAQLPRTTLTHSKLPNPHARMTSTQNFRTSYWRSYPQRRLHTASCQTRMPGRHQRKIFASPIGTATPNTVYTQQAAKPACQEDTNAKFSHLLLAQLPEHSLHTASCQTRMPGRHHRKFFASPIGTATPNTVYTQQGANPHARKTSPQYFRISYRQG